MYHTLQPLYYHALPSVGTHDRTEETRRPRELLRVKNTAVSTKLFCRYTAVQAVAASPAIVE